MSIIKKSAAFIIIGNEILSGRTKDLNLNFIACQLTDMGINLMEAKIVKDIESDIIKSVNELRVKYDYVFTSGGIGPTHDDITALAIAKAFKVNLYRDKVAEQLLRDHYTAEQINEARLKMADIPEGASLLNNPVSSAPGFKIGNVFVMAGVPKIMQSMFLATKEHLEGGSKMKSKMVSAFISEGNIALELAEIQDHNPKVEIGSYPYIRNEKLGTSLVVRSFYPAELESAYDAINKMLANKQVEIDKKT